MAQRVLDVLIVSALTIALALSIYDRFLSATLSQYEKALSVLVDDYNKRHPPGAK